ncbi:diguanylate cyclase [Demequina sp. NBRC 110052]|uniref:GGDEF domain-containing protein n=1 Tax=Demequina sp. NBRC 110052 TaxID=1570341 RepID=UPI000A0787ED|nr:GGDEF domain-containing protein [Demequina sp. NBRC 110052]
MIRVRGRLRDPFAWVIFVAFLALGVIATSSVVVGVRVSNEARDITAGAVEVLADSAAAQLSEASQPADVLIAALESGIAADPTLVDEENIVATLATALVAFAEVGSIQVQNANGDMASMQRMADGYVMYGAYANGGGRVMTFDPTFTTHTAEGDVAEGLAETLDPVAPGERVVGDPLPIGSEGALALPVRVTVYDGIGELVANLMVAIDVSVFEPVLANTTAADVGPVGLYSQAGTLLAGVDVVVPDGIVWVESGSGSLIVDGDWVYYVRPLSLAAGLEWTLVLRTNVDDVVPQAASVSNTMLAYTVIVLALFALFAAVAWVLRRPVGDVSLRARSDAVTGLSNRHHFELRGRDVLRAAQRRGSHAVVAVFDLDGFKAVNDAVGHMVGDQALRAAADALADAAGARDVVARFGGDEFAFVHWLSVEELPGDAVERLRAAAERGLRSIVSDDIPVGVSAGWADTSQGQYRLDALVRAADAAMVHGRRDAKGAAYEGDAAVPVD